MLEYLNFFLLCVLLTLILYLYIRMKRYLPILKMAEELIRNLGYYSPQSDTKRQKLLECVLIGNSKLYLGKVYTDEKIKELSKEEVEKRFNNYEAKLSGQMVKSLGKSIIDMYSIGACAALGITNQKSFKRRPWERSFLKLCSSKIYLRIALQIRFVLSSIKHWNNYEQTLFIWT